MKRWLFTLAIVIVVTGVLLGVRWRARSILRGDRAFALLSDVVGYVESNDHRLPDSWQQFTAWYEHSHEQPRWRAAELDQMFDLQWGAHVNALTSGATVLLVKDASMKPMEQELNSTFWGRFARVGVTTNPVE